MGIKKMELKAGFTIEAAYVMGIVLWVLVVMIQQAYKLHDRTISKMTIQEMTELARHEEYEDTGIWNISGDESVKKILENGKNRTDRLFSYKGLVLKLEKTKIPLRESSINCSVSASDFAMDITAPVYEPEEFMRMFTLLQ